MQNSRSNEQRDPELDALVGRFARVLRRTPCSNDTLMIDGLMIVRGAFKEEADTWKFDWTMDEKSKSTPAAT